MKKNIILTFILLIFITGCGATAEKAPINPESEDKSAEAYSDSKTKLSETADTSEKRIADYNSYDELSEDIKNLLDVREESDTDTFFDRAEQYEWFTFCMW